MNNIIRFYNKNRFAFWIGVIMIVLTIIIIHFLNYSIKVSNESKANKLKNTIVSEENYENKISINSQISNEQVKQDVELIIDQFIRLCNNQEIQQAYDLLTDECKENIFPNIEYFKENYYQKLFNVQKMYSKERYNFGTYKVKFYENLLSTGNYNETPYEDYYTIINKNGEIMLNISNYIGKVQINKKASYSDFEIEVLNKNIYSDYEEYEIKFTNLTYKTIVIDSLQSTKTMYLESNKGAKFYSYSHELISNNLIVESKAEKTIKIKYAKTYSSSSTSIEKIVFSDIITDYEQSKNKMIAEIYI